MTRPISVALIGAGSMGGALLRGWLDKGVIDGARSAVFDPAISEALAAKAREKSVAINPPLADVCVDTIVLAIKPQIADAELPRLARIARGALVISVMAGRSIASIAALLSSARIVRAMPNLPAAVGAGVTGLFAPVDVVPEERTLAEALMRAVGDVVWVDGEEAIDAVTAVSGSGPAYFFLLAEALADAGRALGLTDGAATTLARATLAGAGAYAARDARSLAELRRAVSSTGGTTEAALAVLDGEDETFRRLMKEATAAAASRAKDLTR